MYVMQGYYSFLRPFFFSMSEAGPSVNILVNGKKKSLYNQRIACLSHNHIDRPAFAKTSYRKANNAKGASVPSFIF